MSPGALPRIRRDRVALRLLQTMHDTLHDTVPDGYRLLFTVSAPIREPARTAAALATRARTLLATATAPAEHTETINGNATRLRLVRSRSPKAPRVTGFVHTPHPSAGTLLDQAETGE